MRKIITVLLVIGNIVSFQFQNATQHTRDNFDLCGNSYSESKNQSDDEIEVVSEIRRNQGKQNPSKDLLKEIKTELNDHIMMSWMNVNLVRNHSNSYLLSMEEIKVDDLFTIPFYKPS